ncbi:DUF1109 domain-containing protein [Caulobacter hibisci]|uniref:DUF1109 domain-containing protein n=1 Tax=Caulobacter hibisci TaxID=2035993 RepID=A0ABS0SRJ2_9CAUL|nr:DUF1109 domain-containing protein [Caulobacter hibisci]MBI1682225.1 DUF1109 domain-containing protein [Caulobacter hibisci]
MAFDDAIHDDAVLARNGAGRSRGRGARAARPAWLLAEIGVAGGLAALLLIFFWLDLRPDIESAPAHPFFWLKMAFTVSLGAAGFDGFARLLRGGPPAPTAIIVAVIAMLVFAVGGVTEALRLEPAMLARQFFPASIGSCLFNVVALALPTLLLSLTALRCMERERSALVGFSAGIFAGGLAASVYGLHCPHATFLFVGLWYGGGVLLCGLAGAAINRLTA